jgi:hypothetical protein
MTLSLLKVTQEWLDGRRTISPCLLDLREMMIDDKEPNLVRSMLYLAVLLLGGCNGHHAGNAVLTLKYDPDLFGKDVGLTIANDGPQPLCFLRGDLDARLSNVVVRQNGRELTSTVHVNREIVRYKDVNVSGGLEVVPTGRRNFFIDISPIPIQAGQFTISVKIMATRCSDIFDKDPVAWHPLNGTTSGDFSR